METMNKHTIECNVLMMDTNNLSKKGQICDTAYGIAIDGSEDGGVGMGKHLYILLDEEPKEGDIGVLDWEGNMLADDLRVGKVFIQPNGEIGLHNQFLNKSVKNPNFPNAKLYKVIATTDKLPIGNYQGSIEYNGEIIDLNDYLPQIPQSFIEKFIGGYNQGNVISKVLVEVEYKYIQVYPRSGRDFQGNEKYETVSEIKLNQNNEISIVTEQTETIQEFMDRHAITEQQLMYGYTKGLELMFNELNKS